MMMNKDPAGARPEKTRRVWVRYERAYSDSMWHAGWKELHDGRWVVAYMDDASRFITGYGVFDDAMGAHAIQVLKEAVSRYGRPASMLTGRGVQFYAGKSELGASEFEKEMVRLGIRHILARINQPQTNGKLGRFFRELQRMLPTFEESSVGNTTRIGRVGGNVGGPLHGAAPKNPVQRLIEWYNQDRMHMSLGDGTETPAEAYARKASPATKVNGEERGA